MWFEKLTGFDEVSPENVRENIYLEGQNLVSKVNGKSYQFGNLEIPTLATLKAKLPDLAQFQDKIQISEVVGDVQELHCKPENANALFQAASQFNLLEMVNPRITPEEGVDEYELDLTQGPACAIACGAGTIYRNYFVPVNGKIGQSAENQIDCLELVGKALNNEELQLWKMRNGYALASQEGLLNINKQLAKMSDDEREKLKDKLKIGIQWNTEVTLSNSKQLVSQAYSSALPVAYSFIEDFYWEQFATLILEATYEANLYTGLINLQNTKSSQVFLTLVGGGAFGNDLYWIRKALVKTFKKFKNTPLDIKIVSYGQSNPMIQDLIEEV